MKRALEILRGWLDSPRAIYAVVGVGLLVRILGLALTGAAPLRGDALGYEQMALQLLHHETFSPYWPPGVPYYLMVLHRIFGESILVARAANLPVYAVFSVVLYWLVREIGSARAGNLAALIFVVDPPYVRYAYDPFTEYPAAACLAAAVYLLTRACRKPSLGLSLALGLCLGLLVLFRPSSVLMVLFAAALLILRTRRPGLAIALALVAAAVIAPWVWKAHSMTGRFMMNDSNWENFFLGNNPSTPLYRTWPGGQAEAGFPSEFLQRFHDIRSQPPAARAVLYRKIAFEHIESRPDLFLLRTLNRARAYFGFPIHRGGPAVRYVGVSWARSLLGPGLTLVDAAFYWLIMGLAIVFLLNFRESFFERDSVLPILGAALAYALAYWVSFSHPRFNFPVVPLFAAFAALLADSLLWPGPHAVLQPAFGSARRRRVVYISLALFLFVQLEWAVVNYAGI